MWTINWIKVQPIHRWMDIDQSWMFPPSKYICVFNFDEIRNECGEFLWLSNSTRWSSRVSVSIECDYPRYFWCDSQQVWKGELERSTLTMMTFFLFSERTSKIEILLIDIVCIDRLLRLSHRSIDPSNDQSRTIEVVPECLQTIELRRWHSIVWSVVKSSDTITKIYVLYRVTFGTKYVMGKSQRMKRLNVVLAENIMEKWFQLYIIRPIKLVIDARFTHFHMISNTSVILTIFIEVVLSKKVVC